MDDRFESLYSDLRHNHTPDSIKDEIRQELRSEGFSDEDIRKIETEVKWWD
jgi:hypothetical protein